MNQRAASANPTGPAWLKSFRKTRRPLLLGHRGRLVVSVDTTNTLVSNARSQSGALSPRLNWLVDQLDQARVPATFIVEPDQAAGVLVPVIDSPLEHELAIQLPAGAATGLMPTDQFLHHHQRLQAAGIPLRTAAVHDPQPGMVRCLQRAGIGNLVPLKPTRRFATLSAIGWNLHQLPVTTVVPQADDWLPVLYQDQQLLSAAEEAQTLHWLINTEALRSWRKAQQQLARLLAQAAELRARGMLTPVTLGELSAAHAEGKRRLAA